VLDVHLPVVLCQFLQHLLVHLGQAEASPSALALLPQTTQAVPQFKQEMHLKKQPVIL
jgi:hypothetical protein